MFVDWLVVIFVDRFVDTLISLKSKLLIIVNNVNNY